VAGFFVRSRMAGMQRTTQRRLSLIGLTALGISAIAGVFDGVWLFRTLSARYLGYFCIGLVLLGLFGFNAWIGGPLDPRRDDEPQG
jgi:uncharacterized membrane protein